MKYTQIPATTFEQIQLNAGILCTSFTPASGVFSGILGATTGGITFAAAPTYSDYGDDIDNCPKNTKELKKQDDVEVTLSGTFVTIDAAGAKRLMATADIDSQDTKHIVPRKDIEQGDFDDLWWVGDYSDINTGASAGYCAIHLMNALNTGGFQIKTTDKGKGNFAFTFTGHFSMDAQDTVPYEVYIKASGSLTPSIELNKHAISISTTGTYTLKATTVPANATVTWVSSASGKASVTAGTDTHIATVEGSSAGDTIVTASITEDGHTYSDTCTVIVTSG